MNKNVVDSMINISKIHSERLSLAIEKLAPIFPISATKIQALNEHEFLLLELLTNRFAKLQDFIGSKLIDIYLESVGESLESLTILDKVHKLEKFHVIEDGDTWMEMRQLRNHLSHEYPDHPEITAAYLNEAYISSQQLLQYLQNILKALEVAEDK